MPESYRKEALNRSTSIILRPGNPAATQKQPFAGTPNRATLPRGPIAAGSLNRRSSMALVSRDEAQELKRAYTTLFWRGEGCAQTQEQRVDGVMLRGSCGTRERDREDF